FAFGVIPAPSSPLLPSRRSSDLAAMTGQVGHGANHGDGHVSASIESDWWVESPDAGALDNLVAHAGNDRRGVIFHCHLLAAISGIGAGNGRPPGARGIGRPSAIA